MVTDKTRREAFITQNLGLVHACAGRFRGRGMEYDDLYSAGCVGLIKAYDNFDESRGVCFSTYAVPVILGEIKKLFRDGGTVKVSRSLKELGMRVQAAREHTMKLCGAEPTLQQLAEQLDEPIENVALAIQAAQPAMSLTPEDVKAAAPWVLSHRIISRGGESFEDARKYLGQIMEDIPVPMENLR